MTPIGCHRQKNQPPAASKPFGVLSLRLVPMVTNDTNGKIYNGTIGKTPNATYDLCSMQILYASVHKLNLKHYR